MRVSAIGSPIGKIAIGAPLGPELDRMRRIADVAAAFGHHDRAGLLVLHPGGRAAGAHRQQVIDRMGALAEIAAERGIVLAHENEKEIYGDIPRAVRRPDRHRRLARPAGHLRRGQLRAVRGPAARRRLRLLRPYLVYLQVKDALAATGEVVPAGQGDGQVRETLAALRDSGFEGYVSLEPHLATAGRFGGFSGPEGFRRAAQALKAMLGELSIPWR